MESSATETPMSETDSSQRDVVAEPEPTVSESDNFRRVVVPEPEPTVQVIVTAPSTSEGTVYTLTKPKPATY
jgi:hypothetical protein